MGGIYAELHELVKDRLEDWPSQREGYHWPGYTYDHTLRVVNLATHMARRLKADAQIVRFAALLHDIRKDAGREHAQVGAAEVRELLPGYGLPADFIEAVAGAIECHSGGNTACHPLENLCLGDADLIDANFGLVATWRFITIRSGRGEDLEGTIVAMAEWLPKKDALVELLNTDLGREITATRSRRMHGLCARFRDALAGAGDGGGFLWLARYIHENADTGRLQMQLEDLSNGTTGTGLVPPVIAPTLRTLAAEVAGET